MIMWYALRVNRIFEGLKIIEKYQPNFDTYAEHDTIYIGSYNPDEMTEQERVKMEELGWFEGEDSWQHFT